jgi:hypothetical protein
MKSPPQIARELDALADSLLVQSTQLRERPHSMRADTWRQLRERALEISPPVRSNRSNDGWPLLGLTGAALALLAALLLWNRTPSYVQQRVVTVTPAASPSQTVSASDDHGPVAPRAASAVRHEAAHGPTEVARSVSSDGWTEVDLIDSSLVFVAPSAFFELPREAPPEGADYVVQLESGELCVQVAHRDPSAGGSFVVRTPELRAVAIGTRFCVFAGPSLEKSRVEVEEGQVRVDRMGHRSVVAAAGRSVAGEQADAEVTAQLPAQPPPATGTAAHALSPSGPSGGRCMSDGSMRTRESCLWRQTAGSGLAAQNALYFLGTLAQSEEHDPATALSIWTTYMHRFPKGELATETTWAMFDELVAEHRFEEASSAADLLLRDPPEHGAVWELALKRGDLLAGALHRPAEATRVYKQIVEADARPAVREEALFKLGFYQQRIGDLVAARVTWLRYQREFYQGRYSHVVSEELDHLRGP